MKKLVNIFLLSIPLISFGQQPLINSIAPTHIEVGQTVTISGANLGGRVFFGGVEATSISGSGNVMEATVPPGATHGSITVLNNSLVAQSSQKFFISFSGSTISDFDAEFQVNSTQTDANDICLCDLDGDDLNDVVISHSVADNTKSEVSIYHNQSGPATAATAFTKLANINNSENLSGFISTTCADLDNDGKPELIFTTNQGTNTKHIYVYRNQSTAGTITMTYLSSLNLRLPNTSAAENRVPRSVKSADLDGDGKNDLVVGNDIDNTFHIFRNTSTPGSFSFSTASEISSDGDLSGVLDIADLNNDGRMDVISMPFRENSTRIHIFKNKSIVGSFSFEAQAPLSNGGQTNSVTTADFDEDGLIDIAVASRNTGLITTFRNSTSGSSFTFDSGENITIASASPFGLDAGDINGDGKPDIISSFAVGDVVVVPNTSTSGDISFGTENRLTTSSTTQNVCVGDLNGDGKPDVAYALDVSPGIIGKLGVFMNRNCIAPAISPLGLNYCTASTFRLFATNALDATYNWTITAGAGASPGNTGSNNFADFNIPTGSSVTVQVTVTQSNTTCTTPTAVETFALNASVTTPPAINATPAGIICAGDPLTLSSSTTNNTYQWTLPDGTTSSSASIVLSSVTAENAGDYKLRVQNDGSCASSEVTTTIQVSEPPLFQIFNNGNDTFCDDGANDPQLEVSSLAGFGFQWKLNSANITGETGTTYTATQSGDYAVAVTDANGCIKETEVFTVTELTQPVASLDAAASPTETCVDFETTFLAGSTVQTGFTPVNSWVIEDASNTVINTASGDDLVYTFTSVGTYEVILTTTYDPSVVSSCSDTFSHMVTVSAAPVIVFDVADDTEKCQAEGLTVGVTTPASASISSYEWSVNGNTTASATAEATTLPGVDSVYAVLTITTTIGCTVKDSVKIKNFPTDADISSPDFDVSSDTVTLEEASSIALSAENIVSGFSWSPDFIVDNPAAASVIAFPSTSTTTLTLTGTDINGCLVSTTVTIILDNIRPRRTFSPNGDGINDFWEILNTDVLQGCEIFIFDSRGKNIVVKDSPFPNNEVWDGNAGGTQVPEGLYYFVLKCNDSNLTKSGSILLAR